VKEEKLQEIHALMATLSETMVIAQEIKGDVHVALTGELDRVIFLLSSVIYGISQEENIPLTDIGQMLNEKITEIQSKVKDVRMEVKKRE
jgi:hypothetical protein